MQKRKLGRTGLEVSAICLGTMTFGDQNSEAEAHALLDRAVEAGVNFLDTAELYPSPPKAATQGRTEAFIGSWLKRRSGSDGLVVASKVIGRSQNTWFRDGGLTGRLDRAQVAEAVEKSLRRLCIETIDLYQIHWPDRFTAGFGSNPTRWSSPARAKDEVPIEETMEALAHLAEAGKVRHIGLSNESAWGTMRWVAAADGGHGPRIASIQNAYSLVNRTFETNLAEIAEREDVGLLAYSPLAQGYLTGKYSGGALPEGSRKQLFNRLQRYETPGASEAFEAYVALARDFALKPATFANAFVLSKPFVTSTIVGATSVGQFDESLAAAEVTWTEEMDSAVDALHQRFGNPCP